MNVYQKLNAAREQFHKLKLNKSGHNKFAGYKYFELGDFLIPAMKVFKDQGLCSVVSFSSQYAEMCIVNEDKPDEKIVISSPLSSAALKGCHEVQNLGAVETYQRRYLWVAALEIVEHDAIDSAEPTAPKDLPDEPKVEQPKAEPKVEPPKVIAGKAGSWQIKVSLKPEGDAADWVEAVSSTTSIALDNTKTADEVMQIFKVNRVIYDQLKLVDKDAYEQIMDVFKSMKAKRLEKAA